MLSKKLNSEKEVTVDGKKFKLFFPTIGQATSADVEYSKAFINAIKAGILPRVVLEKQYKENAIWGEEQEEKIASLVRDIQECLVRIKSDPENSQEARIDFEVKKSDLTILNMQKQTLFVHTAENKGEEAKITAIAWQCIKNEDGNKIWNSQKEFLDESNDSTISNLLQEFILFTSGLDGKMNSLDALMDMDEDDEEENEAIEIQPEKEITKEEAQVVEEKV